MEPRKRAIQNLLKFLNKSEAGRFSPPKEAEEPKAEEEHEGLDAETMEALQALTTSEG